MKTEKCISASFWLKSFDLDQFIKVFKIQKQFAKFFFMLVEAINFVISRKTINLSV